MSTGSSSNYSDMSPVLPEKVTVYYPGRRCSGQASDTVPLWYDDSSNLSDVSFTDPGIDKGFFKGVPTSILIIHDTCQALMTPGTTDPTNKSALDDLTDQIAQDFYDFRSFSGDTVYIGICAFVPVALYDYIEFIYDADEPDDDDYDRIEAIEDRIRPHISTRLFTEPWNGEVQEMQHMDPAVKSCTDHNNSDKPVEVVPCVMYYEGTATCTGGGGKATATIDTSNTGNGAISSISVTNGGVYTSTPMVAISGDGTGAKFTAVLTGNAVSTVTVNNSGVGYSSAIISFNGGGSKLQLVRRKLCLEDGRLVSSFISYDTIG